MIFWIILVLALILSVAMIVMVLLQPSKGGGITAAFGGIGGTLGSTFGQRRTLEALGKGTTYIAITIAVLCLMANLFFVPRSGGTSAAASSVTEGAPATTIQSAPGPGTGLNTDPNAESSVPATGEGNSSAPATEGSSGNSAPVNENTEGE